MQKFPETVHRLHNIAVQLRQVPIWPGFPLHGAMRYSPFMIVGAGRSGTTLLRRFLCTQPGIHVPPETYVLGPVISAFRQYRRMRWKDLVHLILSKFQFHGEFSTFQVELGPLVRQLVTVPKKHRNLAYILDQFYRYHAAQTGQPCVRWGDKTPINTFALPRLLAVFPDAKFVNMVRNGYDVANSYVESGIYTDYEQAAWRWVESVRAVDRFRVRHAAHVIDVRYEALIKNPVAVMSEVADFIGIEFLPELIEQGEENRLMGDVECHQHHARVKAPLDAGRAGRGIESMTSEQIQAVTRIISAEARRLGYPVAKVGCDERHHSQQL